jgi:hypothetical protein
VKRASHFAVAVAHGRLLLRLRSDADHRALTVPPTRATGNLIVFIGPIKFLDRKDISQGL